MIIQIRLALPEHCSVEITSASISWSVVCSFRLTTTHLGTTEPRWAPCWSHELCYLCIPLLRESAGCSWQRNAFPYHYVTTSSRLHETDIFIFDLMVCWTKSEHICWTRLLLFEWNTITSSNQCCYVNNAYASLCRIHIDLASLAFDMKYVFWYRLCTVSLTRPRSNDLNNLWNEICLWTRFEACEKCTNRVMNYFKWHRHVMLLSMWRI